MLVDTSLIIWKKNGVMTLMVVVIMMKVNYVTCIHKIEYFYTISFIIFFPYTSLSFIKVQLLVYHSAVLT